MASAPDPLLDAQLRVAAAAARAEWRVDEEHWAGAALEQWQHARTLVDLARDHLHRGDTISLRWPGSAVSLTGRVTAVSDDALAVDAFTGRVDVSLAPGLALAWRVVEQATRGGSRGDEPLTFRARLLELEAIGAPVDVAALDDEIVRGAVRVGRDHVQVVGGDARWVLALSALRWVRAPAPG